MKDHPGRSTRAITLTLLAAITATGLSACGRSRKDEDRARNACREDPRAEDCTSGGRSHSGAAYFLFGRMPFGSPSYYATTGSGPIHAGGSGAAGTRETGTAAAGDHAGTGGTTTTGGFGGSAEGHAGGGGGE